MKKITYKAPSTKFMRMDASTHLAAGSFTMETKNGDADYEVRSKGWF